MDTSRSGSSKVLFSASHVFRLCAASIGGWPSACSEPVRAHIQDNDPDAEDVKRTAHREASLMTQLKSDHVVQCLDSFLVRDRLCIVMEYMPLTLLDFLESRNGGRGLSSDVIRHLMYQVCKVMTFIHDQVRLPRGLWH